MNTLIAGNWKMNKLPSEAESWAMNLRERLIDIEVGAEVLVCAPFTHLLSLSTVLEDSPVAVGAQDLSQHESGAYTGEVSAAMLRDAGASYVIVGHSERRAYHQESDEVVNAKLKRALAHGLRPILCVGENEAERERGEAKEVVLGQLKRALEGVSFENPDDLVIAYEPVWAIGTGKTATAEDAEEMGATLREALRERYGDKADGIRLLYGGSMKPGNAAELLAKPDVNGGLIGGASLDLDDFVAIVEAAS